MNTPPSPKSPFRRILLKLSGEALIGEGGLVFPVVSNCR